MDFRYLTESKNEFFNFLCTILVPNIYNGFSEMLEYSINMYNMLEERKKKDRSINNPGIVNIFKMCLKDISTLNNLEIENEYKKIKQNSKCSEWFDELVKCTFKSHVLFLTYDPTLENSTYKDNDIYNSLVIKDFIHRCYVESSEYFIDNCDIFLKKDKKDKIYEIIKVCITNSIRKTLPYNNILQEYLRINFTIEKKNEESTKLSDIKKMVSIMINKNKYGNKPVIDKLVQDSPSSASSYNGDLNDIEEFINLENKLENKYEPSRVVEIQLSSNDNSGVKLITSTIDDRLEKKNQEIELVMNGGNNLSKISENNSENNVEKTFRNFIESGCFCNNCEQCLCTRSGLDKSVGKRFPKSCW